MLAITSSAWYSSRKLGSPAFSVRVRQDPPASLGCWDSSFGVWRCRVRRHYFPKWVSLYTVTKERIAGIEGSTDAIEEHLDRARVEQDIPGLSVAIFDQDAVLHSAGMGARDIESRSPATPDTRYSIASVTKIFTAVAILQQVECGRLSLEDEIREYVDFWTDVPGDPITVAELLCHASGMPTDYAGRRELLFADTSPTSPILTRADDRRHANGATDRRIIDPETYMYSSRGYQILGEILEEVTDRPFADYVEEEIFSPLGMDRSQVGYDELSTLGDDTAMGYVIEDGEPVANSHDLNSEIRTPHSGGGILSSVLDLATFGRCHLNDGHLDGVELLSPDMVANMQEVQSPTFETIGGQAVGYGYGLRVQELTGEPLVGHTGTAPGISRAYLGLLPESNLGVALAVNTSGVSIGTLGQGVLAIAGGHSPRETVPALSLRSKLERLSGTYRGYKGGLTVTVSVPDSPTHIVVSYEDGPNWEFPAFPESVEHDDYRFYRIRENGIREPVIFKETDSGFELRCNVDRLFRDRGGRNVS